MTIAQSAFARALPFRKKVGQARSAELVSLARVRAVTRIADSFGEVPAGAIGTIVHVHDNGKAFEVEFHTPTHAVLLAERTQIEAE